MTGPALDAVTTAPGTNVNVTSLSWTHVTGTAANRVLLVWTGYNGPASGARVSGVTYGGTALTKLITADPAPGNAIDKAVDLWYLIGPPPGSATVAVSYSGSCSAMGMSGTWAGAWLPRPVRVPHGFANSSSNAPSVSTAKGAASDIVVAGLHAGVTTTVTPGGSQTSLASFLQGGSANNYMSLTTQAGGTGTITSSWSWAAAGMASAAAVALRAAFSDIPLDLQASIDAGGWQDVTTLAYQRDGTSPAVQVTRGRPDGSTQVSPSSASFELNNRSGNFSPKNPLGAYYGSLGRNTPLRWSAPAIGNYLRMEDAESASVCPGASGLDITGDTDVRVDMTLTGTGPYGVSVAGKGYNALYTGSQDTKTSWLLTLNADMTPEFTWSSDGTSAAGQVQCQLPVPSRGRFALRVTLTAATGTVTFYTASSLSGSFTQLGAAASGTGGAATSVYAPAGHNGVLSAGMVTPQAAGSIAVYSTGICGRVWELQLLNGIGGTLAADPVFSGQDAGTTSFTDAQSNTWGMYGTAEISDRDYRYHGELSALPPKWDATGNDQWVAVTAGGLLRRLGQGSAPLLSPMTRYYTVPGAPVTAAYWPMEDASGSTQFGPLTGALPLYFSGSPQLASSSAFAGSGPLPATNGASMSAVVAYPGTWTDNDVHWLMMLPSSPEADGTLVARIATSGSVALLTVTYNTASSGSLTLKGYDGTGTLLFTSSALTGVNGQAYAVQVSLQASGLNAALTVAVPGAGTGHGTSNVFAGSVGAVTGVSLNPAGGLTATVFGHLAVLPSFVSVLALSSYQLASGTWTGPVTAWTGEPAGVRAGRMVIEQGFQFRGIGDLLHSAPMGPQSVSDLVSLLQECADADRGMLFEPRACLGIGYRARTSLYNQAPLVLDYSSAALGGTGTNLEPTFDDQFLVNDETVSRSGGSSSGASARYVLSDGSSMSTGVIGDYTNSDSLNLAYDGQLMNAASWIASTGSVDEARWPSIPLNLARPQVQTLWWQLSDLDAGDRFQLANLPDVVMPDSADQLAVQLKESFGGKHYAMDWCATPARPYTVGTATAPGSPGIWRVVTAGTVVSVNYNSVVTTMVMQVTAGSIWTTDPGQFPFDINVGGERITVGAITGSGTTQTFSSLTRSVNGVVKAQTAGTPVQVWTPFVAAL